MSKLSDMSGVSFLLVCLLLRQRRLMLGSPVVAHVFAYAERNCYDRPGRSGRGGIFIMSMSCVSSELCG